MAIVLVISLYTSRVILNTLGVDDYGVYNVVAGFVSMFGFLNATLSSSMQRYYNFEGTKRGEEGYTEVYVTGFIIHIVLCAVIFLILETAGIWYVNNVMVVPDGKLFAANVIFHLSIISMLLVIMEIPYTGAIMAYEKMDFYAAISIADTFLKLAAVIALPFIPYEKLIVYSLLVFSITVFDFVLYYWYAKKHFRFLRLCNAFSKPLFKSMMSFSGWNLLGTFAFLLKGQGLNMLLNVYFGTVINAARGVAYQVNGAINGFSANIATAFRPQIVNSYANNDHVRTRQMMFVESKICFALLTLLMVPIVLEINYLLKLWLGESVPEYTNIFAILVLVDSLICTLNTPCTQVAFAVGNLKKYQIITSMVNLCLLPASWLCLHLGMDSTSVFIVTILFSIINQGVCIVLLKRIFPLSIKSYPREVIFPCTLLVILLPILPSIIRISMNGGVLRFITEGFIDILAGVALTYGLVLNKQERQYAKTVITKKKIDRYAPLRLSHNWLRSLRSYFRAQS